MRKEELLLKKSEAVKNIQWYVKKRTYRRGFESVFNPAA